MKRFIKKSLHPGKYSNPINLAILLLRIAIGALMLTHGMGKFFKMIGGEPIQFADPLGIGATASLVLAVFAEVGCSILIIFGWMTRFASVILLITMVVAAFVHHADDPFGKQELPILYAIIYCTIAIVGSGKIAIDKLIYASRKR